MSAPLAPRAAPQRVRSLCYFWYTDLVAPWSVLFCADNRGREPVRQWLEGLELTNPKEAGTVRHYIDPLEEFGVFLE